MRRKTKILYVGAAKLKEFWFWCATSHHDRDYWNLNKSARNAVNLPPTKFSMLKEVAKMVKNTKLTFSI